MARLLAILGVLALAGSAMAVTQEVKTLGDGGWMSDDTRNDAGADLVGVSFTHAGKPGQTPTAADDAAIAQQIQFVAGPAGSTYGGAVQIDGMNQNAAKSTVSAIDTATGFAPASDLVGGAFSATYQWYMQPTPTVRTLAFRVGVRSAQWAASQAGFTAIRSGESAWDLILVHIMDSPVSNAWNTPTVDLNNGVWYVYGQAGNPNWASIAGSPPPAGALRQTLAAWQADATWGPILFGTGARLSSIQFGLGSSQRQCLVYVDYLQTTLLNGGEVIDFQKGPIFVDAALGDDTTGDGSRLNPFKTIQKAINTAVDGDTINVAAGTYAEAIVVNKALVIQGAGRDTTIIDATGATADIAVNVNQPGGDVTFDGLAVKTKGLDYPAWTFAMNVVSTTGGSTITVTNSKLEGTDNPDKNECGVYVHGTSAAFVFQHNIVTGTGTNPILIEKNPGATDVSYNTLDAGSWGSSCFYMTYGGVNVTTLQKFSNNTFDLGTGPAFDNDHRVEALSITGAYINAYGAGGYSNIEIKNNHIYNGHAYGRGIGLYNDSGGDGSGGIVSNVVIEGNLIEGLNPANDGTHGLRLAGRVENITVQCNVITGMKDGCLGLTGYYGTHYPASVTLSANSLVGNALAVNWPSAAAQLNAQGNWWGDPAGPGPAGPGAGDKVSTNVDYASWLTKPPVCQKDVLYLEPSAPSIYIKPTETCLVNLKVANLQNAVNGMQALLNFSSTYFIATPSGLGSPVVAPGGGAVWNEMIYQMWTTTGDLDVAIGVDLETPGGTMADDTTAKFTLTPAGTEGVTRMVFRADGENGYATMLSDTSHQPVWPTKVNSVNIYIDGTNPTVVSFSAAPLCTKTTTTLTFTVSDDNAGVDYVDVYVGTTMVAHDVTSPYVLDMSGYSTDCYDVKIKVVDKAGNETDSSPVSVCVDQTAPVISSITATQGGNDVLCPAVAVQGVVDIYVTATDTGCADLVIPPTVAVAGIAPVSYIGVAGDIYHYQVTVLSTTSNGSHLITVTATDALGNTTIDISKSICVDKNQVTGTVELEGLNPPTGGISRTVHFVATGGASTKTWDVAVSFAAGSATGTYLLTAVPAGTTNLSAKTAWTLREKLAVTLDGDNQAVADFVGDGTAGWSDLTDHYLRGGDINGSNSINVLDYSILKTSWNPINNPVADIDGSGSVFTNDYNIMKANWFKPGDPE